jgi:hypothetical protein
VLLGGEPLRVAAGQHLGHLTGEGSHGVEVGPAVQRHGQVEALAAGRLGERRQLQLLQQQPQPQGGHPRLLELVAGGIEVEDELVGMVGSVGPRQPDVRRDAGLVGQVRRRGGVLHTTCCSPPSFSTLTRSTQSGKWPGTSFWEIRSSSIPSG